MTIIISKEAFCFYVCLKRVYLKLLFAMIDVFMECLLDHRTVCLWLYIVISLLYWSPFNFVISSSTVSFPLQIF